MIEQRDDDYYVSSPSSNFAFNLDHLREYSPTDTSFMSAAMADTRRPLSSTLYEMDAKKQEGGFQNPFSSSLGNENGPHHSTIDTHYVSSNNASSSWQSPPTSAGVSYAPASAGGAPTSYYSNIPGMRQAASAPSFMSRPQTSDGLPASYVNGPLPGARSLVNPGGYQSSNGVPGSYGSSGELVGGFPARYGSFDQASTRYMTVGLPSSENQQLQFVSLAGPAPKKRSRRRYDEIERIYACEWRGCDKAYGTLNHLNAHVAMQKHGPKRLPAQFKEMRKEWRRKKREEAANAANKEYAAAAAEGGNSQPSSDAYSAGWQRASGHATPDGNAPMYGSAGPPYSAPSMPHMALEASDPFGHRGSAGSPSDGRFAYTVPQWPTNGYDRKGSLPGLQSQPSGGGQQAANFHPYMMSQKGMI